MDGRRQALLVFLVFLGSLAIIAHAAVTANDVDDDSSKITVTPCDVNPLGQYCCSPFHPEIGCFPTKLGCLKACCSKAKCSIAGRVVLN
uniref:Uncharacterized protein n=1 Tax=Oryza brachyantha TaxID=4533 RepID=J3L0I9_ORYBR